MTHVSTLIGRPEAGSVDGALVARAAAYLPRSTDAVWLAPGDACDIPFTPGDDDIVGLDRALRDAIGNAAVDIVLQPAGGRRKRLLIADMDSTMISQECIDEIADFAGVKPEVAEITERAMRGELDFASAVRERVALLKGLDAAVLEHVLAERITETPGARALVRTMKAHGATCLLVSGGFTFFTSRIAASIGFDRDQANRLDIEAGCLTGRVREPILGRDAKREALRSARAELGLDVCETMAVGDGANDLAMIEEAGLGIAFRAKPIVAAEADARIDHGDLSALLYCQGYARDDFRT